MKREKMLAELSKVTGITTNVVATYDMGIQFDVMTPKGIASHFGEVGNWPFFMMPVTSELIALKEKLIKSGDISKEEILAVKVCEYLLTYTNLFSGQFGLAGDEVLDKCIPNLKKALTSLDTANKVFYAYVDIESCGDGDVFFFNNREDFGACFLEHYGSEDILYEDMTDEQLKMAYSDAKEANWHSIMINSFCD